MCARIEQALLGERARRDEADHVAPHHGFRAALPGLGRVLELLTHSDAVALGDQALEVVVSGAHRHAAHRDVLALMFAPLGERDAERARGDLSVLEEQLVEIAHAVEQQAVFVGRLNLQKLRHHRRGAVEDRCLPAALRRKLCFLVDHLSHVEKTPRGRMASQLRHYAMASQGARGRSSYQRSPLLKTAFP